MASVLRESWKPTPPLFSGTDSDIASVAPILLATGAGGLAWWKLTRAGGSETANPGQTDLRDAYRLHSLQAAMHSRSIRAVVVALTAAGVEPLLVKGWAAARNYPEPGLRPYGDIDLCVADRERAASALATDDLRQCNVDLHEGGQHLIDFPFDEVLARSRRLDLDGIQVRIPCEEHHLRILCLHLLHHGAWRPLWLCDIGAALDAAGDEFDWDVFLGDDPVRAGWMISALRVAESLLGADLSRAPDRIRTASVPAWVHNSVLREWTRSHRWTSARPLGTTIANRPWTAPLEIVRRWPDPIRSCVAFGAPFDRGWRAPYQLRYSLMRLGKAILRTRHSGRT